MGGKTFLIATMAGWLGLALGAAEAKEANCRLGMMAELHVTMEDMSPMIDLKIGGAPARFIVDTGAFFSTVTPRAAEKFKLRPRPLPTGFYLQGASGSTEAQAGTAAEFSIGGATLRNIDFLIAGDSFGTADGLLGQNVLGNLDVEYDLANGVVRIFKPLDCAGAHLAYWPGGASASVLSLAAMTPADPHIIAQAKVNGRPIRVLFDTGASRSMLELSTALHAGATLQDGAAFHSMRGIGRRSVESYILPFDSFEIGDESIKNTRLRVARTELPGADMLLGADFFLSHRILFSKSQRRLYFTYNGGRVFRLDDGGTPPTPPAAPAVAAEKASDAEALGRRAAAAASRRDFAQALSAYDQAISLDPDNARLRYARARVRLATHEPAKAREDLDHALRLDAAYSDALLLRGQLRLGGDEKGAQEDFAAALKAAPAVPEVGLEIAESYVSAGRFDVAIARYDDWIAANPKSFDLGKALNGRCWTRTLLGRDLDKALADCEQAMKRGSRVAAVLDSRGLAHLRRGEFAKALADYDNALKLQPRMAPAFYGRGLAKLKLGDAAGGAADLQAAKAIDPDAVEFLRKLGIDADKVVVAMR